MSLSARALKQLSRWLGWLLVVLILTVALLTVAVRQLLPAVSDYRVEIENFLSESLHTQVSIDHIAASWEGRFPTLLVQGVTIADHHSKTVGKVSVDQLILGINPVSSIIQLQPVLSKVEIWSLKTAVQLAAPKTPKSVDQSTDQGAANQNGASVSDPLAMLWLQPHIFFYDTQIDVNFPSGETVQLFPKQLNLENSSSQHHFTGELLLRHQNAETELTFILESDSQDFDFQQTNFDFYLKLAGLESGLLARAREVLPVPAQLQQLQMNGELWGHWSEGKLASLQGGVVVESLLVEMEDKVEVNDFSSDVILMQRDGNYQLQLKELQAVINGAPLTLPSLIIDSEQGVLTGVSLAQMNLRQVEEWLRSQPVVPDKIDQVLESLKIGGTLKNVQIRWPQSGEGAFDVTRFKLLADLNRVEFSAAYGAPEMKGVTGRLEVDSEKGAMSGRIDLNSDNLDLFFPTVFDHGWNYDYARGVIHWGLADNILTLRSDLLELHKPGINATGRWSLHLPLDSEIQSELTLLIGLKGSDGSLAPDLIPEKVVSAPLRQWVSQAIKKGHLNQGGFMLHTGTRNLDQPRSDALQLFLNIANANVEYQSGWPAVADASANVLLRDGGVEVDISQGRILDSQVEHVWVYLPPGSTRLTVLGRLAGDAADIRTTLLNSPLLAGPDSGLSAWNLAGSATTALALSIPLQQGGGELAVDVVSDLAGGSIKSAKDSLALTELTGRIGYKTNKGLYAEKITGQLFGYPLQASIRTDQHAGGQRTRTVLKSRVGMDQLRSWTGLELLKQAKGVQPYKAVLDICSGADCSGLEVTSNMAKTAITLVPPYSKPVGSPVPFKLVTDFNSPQRLSFSLGDKLRALFELKKGNISRGTLTLGGSAPGLSNQPGLLINGDVDTLQYSDLDRLLTDIGVFGTAGGGLSSGATKSSQAFPNTVVNLNVGDFRYEKFQLTGVSTHLEKQNNQWLLSAMNADMDAVMRLPLAASEPFQVVFGNLNLDRLLVDSEDDAAALSESQVKAETVKQQPGELPDFDININNLVLKEKRWGNWAFKIRNAAGKTLIQDIRGRMDQLTIDGQIDWLQGNPLRSEMRLYIQADDVGQSLATAGFDRVLETEAFSANLQMNWPGAPWQYSLAQVDGALEFSSKNGRLIETGQSAGLLRVFGIFNMNALGRRLSFDFKDVFSKGISFDEMYGNYQIEQGLARTKTPLVLKGPSVDLKMTGDLNLVAETVDTNMQVTLPITDNIPLAAVLLGVPQIAGAAFLLDKLIGDKLKENLATVHYTMQGDWSDPKVELVTSQSKGAARIEE
ncbi:MAG: YhdP family protein [Amphritea sp.]